MSTAIEWADEVWNAVVGCSRVSAGCDHCYAMGVAHRKMSPQHVGLTKLRPRDASRPGVDWTGEVRTLPERLGEPLRWRKPRRVFVNSMSDLFHERVPFEFITKVFALMAATPRHTYLVLTKRPARALEWFHWQEALPANADHVVLWPERARERERLGERGHGGRPPLPLDHYSSYPAWPLPNVHLGVSAEDQATWDERVPLLLECPAVVRWVSAEPLLGPIDITRGMPRIWGRRSDGAWGCDACCNGDRCDDRTHIDRRRCKACGGTGAVPWLDWIVAGGESGPGARRCDVAWLRSVVEQCRDASVPVFVKQLGTKPFERIPPSGAPDDGGDISPIVLRSRKGGDMDEWPADLRVRELPEVRHA